MGAARLAGLDGARADFMGADQDPYDQAMRVSAALVALVALSILVLWSAGSPELFETEPMLFAMPFNAALAFLLAAGAAWCLVSNQPGLARGLALAGLALALVALFEHSRGLGPTERFLASPFASPTGQRRGGMAINTAICFALFTLASLRIGSVRRSSRTALSLLATVLLIAAGSMLGTVMNIAAGEDWMRLARMSPQTALCFALLVLPLYFRRPETIGQDRASLAAFLTAALYVLVTGLTFIELKRQQASVTLPNGAADVQATLIAILLVSGLAFFCLIVYALRVVRRQKQTARELAGTHARLSAIFDNAADGIVTIDERGHILLVNPACERIFGYSTREMVGRDIGFLMPDSDPSSQEGSETREVMGRRRDGRRIELEISTARFPLGRQMVASAILRDVSQRKQHERQILEANAELEEFSYRTSHDLRSPIASSLGLIAICRDMIADGASLADVEPVLARIESGFRRLDQLIQNIILLTRTKVMEEPSADVPVLATVRDSIDRMRLSDEGRQIAFLIDIPETLTIKTKPSRFRIITDTLISNAVRYADPAEALPEVRILAQSRFGWVTLSVGDNGLGIDPADEQNLFQMFKRFHPSRAEGSGLGLYILRKSAEHLGGSVAYRRRAKGSEFSVRLPQGDKA
ncbi:sensor histidine kinase [Rhizobium sp. YIM 134829]|uniref:sensor histidine kinase n=1 Tax=Rhizobium sp. YIM 134829 TaxID=3390453 RepID=UPI003977F3D7